MRNVWKGLVVGGLTGVIAGVILDSLAGASKKAAEVGGQVRDHAPDAGRFIQTVADKAGDWLHDADVPEHVRSVAHKLKESDVAGRVSDVSQDIVSAAREATGSYTS
jgi:hypothetical protein